jgi:beta-lactam-binding protein with PASTA domain
MASAPIFREIARKVSALSGRGRRASANAIARRREQAIPDVVTLTVDAARRTLMNGGFRVESKGSGSVVRSQTPAAGSLAARGEKVAILLTAAPGAPVPEGFTIVPALAGLPMRRAVSMLALQRLSAAVSGSGVTTAQSPAAGTQVKSGTKVAVRCEPKNLSLINLN